MALQLNVNNFKNLIRKGTVNHAIENVKLTFTRQKAISAMRGVNLISCVQLSNNVLSGLTKNDEIDFCFVNPVPNVLQYMDILTGENVDLTMADRYLELKEHPHTVRISLFNPNMVTPFDINRSPNIDFFVDFKLDENFSNFIDKTKRVCSANSFIFLGVAGGFFYVRAGDQRTGDTEPTSEIRLNLVESEFKDVELNFDYRSFISVASLINQDFTLSCSYNDDNELGLIRAETPDKSEVYYLMSRL
jgi:hypothetical protein